MTVYPFYSEPLPALKRRGFWLEVGYNLSPGSICIEQLSGYTFLAFRRTALPTIRIRTFKLVYSFRDLIQHFYASNQIGSDLGIKPYIETNLIFRPKKISQCFQPWIMDEILG